MLWAWFLCSLLLICLGAVAIFVVVITLYAIFIFLMEAIVEILWSLE